MTYLLQTTWYILQGCTITIRLFVLTMLFSLPLGFVCAVGKTSKRKSLTIPLEFYTSVIRGTPLLLQLFFVYYGLPLIIPALRFERFTAADISMGYMFYLLKLIRQFSDAPENLKSYFQSYNSIHSYLIIIGGISNY